MYTYLSCVCFMYGTMLRAWSMFSENMLLREKSVSRWRYPGQSLSASSVQALWCRQHSALCGWNSAFLVLKMKMSFVGQHCGVLQPLWVLRDNDRGDGSGICKRRLKILQKMQVSELTMESPKTSKVTIAGSRKGLQEVGKDFRKCWRIAERWAFCRLS